MKIKVNVHARQSLWCDGCKAACIAPGEEYTQLGDGNFCQSCEAIAETAKAGALG